MKSLFRPAIGLMGRLRYAHKFLLLGLLALIAIVVLQLSLYRALDQIIEPSRRELAGLDALMRLNRVIQLVQQDRGLAAGLLSGNAGFAARQQDKAAEVGSAMSLLGLSLPPPVQTGSRWGEIQTDWDALHRFGLNWPQRTNTLRHEQLIGRMLALASDVADASSLTLDHDLSSYYLMDTLVKLPFFTERLGQTRGFGAAILARKVVSDAEKVEMARLLGHTHIARDMQKANLDKVMAYNPALRAHLATVDREVETAFQAALTVVQSEIIDGRFKIAPAVYFDQFTALIDHIYAEGNAVLAPALREHIERRVDEAQVRLAWTAGLSVLACVLFAYLAVGAYLALTDQIRHVLHSLQVMGEDGAARAELVAAIAAGDLSRTLPEPRQPDLGGMGKRPDEIGALAVAIAAMASAQQGLGRGFARMVRTLRLHRDEGRRQDWYKSGFNALNIELRVDRELADMAQAVINFVVRHVDAASGALYLHDPASGRLQLVASHGAAAGLPLQCTPQMKIALPLTLDGEMTGMLEIGSAGVLDEARVDWLQQAAEAVAVAIGAQQARRRMAALLEQTESQRAELARMAAGGAPVRREELQVLAEDVRRDLRQAVLELDQRRLACVLAVIEGAQPALAMRLRHMTGAFRYRELCELLSES
jgi:HAMP domain-containing protein